MNYYYNQKGLSTGKAIKVLIGQFIIALMIILAYYLVFNNSIGRLIERIPLSSWGERFVSYFENESTYYPLLSFSHGVIWAPIREEILFRGIIADGLLKRYKRSYAIIISAIIFGISHMNMLQAINAFLIGIILAIIYCKTRSLILCMIAHAINNLIAQTQILTSYLSSNWGIAIGIIIIGMSVFYYNRYRDKLIILEAKLN